MQGPKAEGGDDVVTDINITPLCDILVVLLIIFMVTANATALQGPKISSPANIPVTDPITQAKVESINITIDETNRISCNGKMVDRASLEQALKDALPQTTKQQVMIRAHHSLTLENVMEVMEAAERSGAKEIGIGTQFKNF